MKTAVLSEQSLSDLREMVHENYEETFIWHVGAYVLQVRDWSEYKPDHRAAAQKRIDKVKKAFAKLTDQDKTHLDMEIVEELNPPPACENMIRALNRPVPSMRMDLSRLVLLDFATQAVRSGWIDVSVDSTVLRQAIQIIMKEAGVKHDAVAIALEAVKTS